MTFSQNKEEDIIKMFFQSPAGNLKVLNLLSIGENDGETLSNVRALIQAGWWAVLIEPDEKACEKLRALYQDNDRVKVLPIGIGDVSGIQTFYSSGTHLNKGDIGLLSTFDKNELGRFPGTEWEETIAEMMTWRDFYEHAPGVKKFELISIDAENFDLIILQQIDFNETETKLVIVEWNGKDRHLYDAIMYKFNFTLIHINGENLIYGR